MLGIQVRQAVGEREEPTLRLHEAGDAADRDEAEGGCGRAERVLELRRQVGGRRRGEVVVAHDDDSIAGHCRCCCLDFSVEESAAVCWRLDERGSVSGVQTISSRKLGLAAGAQHTAAIHRTVLMTAGLDQTHAP